MSQANAIVREKAFRLQQTRDEELCCLEGTRSQFFTNLSAAMNMSAEARLSRALLLGDLVDAEGCRVNRSFDP